MKEAAAIGGEDPAGWRTVNREVYYEALADRWVVRFEIVKYDGERVTLNERPTTLLSLANAVLDTLIQTLPNMLAELVDADHVAEFKDYAERLLALTAGENTDAPSELAPLPAPVPA